MLGNFEDHTALSRTLSQLEGLRRRQTTYIKSKLLLTSAKFSELLSDYIHLTAVVKGVYDYQMKGWQKWEDVLKLLGSKKYETGVKNYGY